MDKEEKNKKLRSIIELILLLILCGAITFILINKFLDYQSQKNLSALQNNVKDARERSSISFSYSKAKMASSDSEEDMTNVSEKSGDNVDENVEEVDYTPILSVYKELHDANENFYGWLVIDGTPIDYPVMQGPDNEFYLSHNLERKYDKFGTLIMDIGSKDYLECPHLIVYGHNVKNGDLFGELINYRNQGYYKHHPEIVLDNLYESTTYEIFAVFRTSIEEAQTEEHFFTTYKFDTDEEYQKILTWAKNQSIYDIDYVPQFGDGILSLVTCEYSKKNGRFVVMAAKKNSAVMDKLATPSETAVPTSSATPTGTAKPTPSATPGAEAGATHAATPSDSPSESPSADVRRTPEDTPSASPSAEATEVPTVIPDESPSPEIEYKDISLKRYRDIDLGN